MNRTNYMLEYYLYLYDTNPNMKWLIPLNSFRNLSFTEVDKYLTLKSSNA